MKLPKLDETGNISINYLKRFWAKQIQARQGKYLQSWQDEKRFDKPLLDSLGIGLGPTLTYLLQESPSFAEFESWIQQNGHLDSRKHLIDQFNLIVTEDHAITDRTYGNVLSEKDLDHFHKEGYIIVKQAITKQDCLQTMEIFESVLELNLDDPSSWYAAHPLRHGVMVEYFQDKQLEKNRLNPRIQMAFAQLWQSNILWPSTDRISFNPPETLEWKFSGPFLHLDLEPMNPISFGTQGLVYLTDTAKDQGAFQLIPGFHHHIDQWVQRQENPMTDNFPSEEAVPVEGEMGDLIIWHHGLPHGSSPNRSDKPRLVQYINYYRPQGLASGSR